MCPNNLEISVPSRPKGRPPEGIQTRAVERKIRLEPWLDQQLCQVCRYLGISKSEGIRQGIQLFLREAARQYGGK